MLLTISLIFFSLLLFFPVFKRKIKLWQWEHRLSLKQHHQIFQQLYTDVDGFALSKIARKNQDAMDYVYGEIEFKPFIALLSLCHPGSTTVFYDLGSGTGKAVVAAMMVFNLKKAYGIELLTPLHQSAQQQQECLKANPAYAKKANRLEFIQANFLTSPLHDANLIFINATSFFGDTWQAISRQLEQTQPGTVVITTSKTLCSSLFKRCKSTIVKMSWGFVEAYIQQRM